MKHDEAQSEYLLDSDLIYLNTAALGITPRTVLACMQQASQDLAAYPNRIANDSQDIYLAAEQVRERAAAFIGCGVDELLITRSTTDSMNTIAQGMQLNAGDRVLTTDREHDGGSRCWQHLARRDGVIVDTVPIALTDHDPRSIVQRFAAAITRDTRVIIVSHVIASTGLRMPIAEIAALTHERGILCVVDGAQAVGGIDVDVKSLGVHAYATSGHKWLMGPKGTGLLYVSREAGARIQPIQWEGGKSLVENSTAAGNPPLILALGAAINAIQRRGMTAVETHNIALRNYAYAALMRIPKIQLVSPPPGSQATAIISIKLPNNIDSEHLCATLRAKHRIIVKMVEKKWFNGIRLSPHVFNTEADIEALLQALHINLFSGDHIFR